MVIEQAKNELKNLETQYPNSFHSLKLDLKTFISQLEEEENLSSHKYYSIPIATTASTHVSSTGKKRKKGQTDVKEKWDDDEAQSKMEMSKMLYMKRSRCNDGYGKRRDMSTNAVIERARVCLQKVQQFKTSFFQY